MKNINFRTFQFKLNDVEDDGLIKGYASTFGNVDLGMDIVDKGAFKKSLRENRGVFPILADHDPSKQIGWNMKADEDDNGLYVEGKLDLNVQSAREKYSLAKTALGLGAAMGLSIGYMTIKAEPNRDNPMIRHLKEVKLFEYSMVTFPMNTEAMVTAAKTSTGLDRIRLVLKDLEQNGITREELLMALKSNSAAKTDDPKLTLQSFDKLIAELKS